MNYGQNFLSCVCQNFFLDLEEFAKKLQYSGTSKTHVRNNTLQKQKEASSCNFHITTILYESFSPFGCFSNFYYKISLFFMLYPFF